MPPFERAAYVSTELDRPSITLIDQSHHLGILLARQTIDEADERVLLRAVRWVRVPQRWRLPGLRLLVHLHRGHLPDEWLFNEVNLTYASGIWRADIDSAGTVLPRPSASPFPRRALADSEYWRLIGANGRELHADVV